MLPLFLDQAWNTCRTEFFCQQKYTYQNLHYLKFIKNIDLKIRNRINPYVDGMIIDAYGKKGMTGQTLTIDANSKMKWA